MRWCAATLCLGLLGLARAALAEDAMLNQCDQLKPQGDLDLSEVMGKWYVVEVIEHKSDSRQAVGGSVGYAPVVVDACPIVMLKPSGGRAGPTRFSLLWEESAGSLEYTFWVPSNRMHGIWNADIIQNGTLAEKSSYRQFVGTVQVTKAVAQHLVLTFCARNPEGQKFSVLLGREHKLSKTDVRGVHKLLERRNLQLLSIRETCANGCASQAPLLLLVLLLPLASALRNRH